MISDIFHPLYQGKPRRQSWKTWINIAQDDLTKFHNLGFQCRQKIFLDFKSNYLELCFDDSATNFFLGIFNNWDRRHATWLFCHIKCHRGMRTNSKQQWIQILSLLMCKLRFHLKNNPTVKHSLEFQYSDIL